MTFFLACVPPKTAHHAKRIVRIGGFARMADTPALQQARGTLEALLLPHQPAVPVTGPVVLTLDLTWPWLQADRQRDRQRGRIPHDRKPDWDNAAKAICDTLARLRFFEQDSAIVDGRVRKWRGDTPGIRITLQPWQEATSHA